MKRMYYLSLLALLCDGCHGVSMIAYEFENIAILNKKGVDYRRFILNMSRGDAINGLNNSELDDMGSL